VGTLVKLLGAVVLAGALVAGLLFPLLGGPVLAADDTGGMLRGELPAEFSQAALAGNSVLLAANGEPIAYFYDHNRQPVPSDRISDRVKQALVAIEDSRFFEHHGLDVEGTTRALVTNLVAGGVQEGGSTLTQQLVKQTLLQTAATPEARAAATEQTVGRKLREARIALALEDAWTKDEILTRYLNVVYFGNNSYGVQAAARTYFGRDAADLDLPQAALLAGLVQSPTADDPFTAPEAATSRRNEVLSRMGAQGRATPEDVAAAQAAPLELAPSPAPPRGCAEALVGGFFCSFAQQWLITTGGLTQQQLDRGGLTIRTTLDADLQRSGDAGVLDTLPMGDELAGMFTAVQPGTGHLLAMSVNRRFGCTGPECESVNLNVVPSQGSGSTYKLFVAAAALARGYSSYYTQTTSDPYTSRVYTADGGPYQVENAADYRSTLDLTTALYQSSNTYFLALEDALGSVEEPVRMAEAMGLFAYSRPGEAQQIIDENRGSFTFGAEATSPLGLASAYSTVFSGGTRCDVVPVTGVTGPDGQPATAADGSPLPLADRCTPEAIPPGVATTLTQMLRKDVEPGNPGQTAARAYVPGHQIAGKTGTSQNNYSIAFVGSTPEVTASVMVLNPKRNQDVGGFGGRKGAQIWHDSMEPILDARGSGEFAPADPKVENGNTKPVPGCSSVRSCQRALADAGFRSVTARVDDDAAPGAFIGTSPPRGSRAAPGQTVTILVSNGSDYVPPRPRRPAPAPAPAPGPAPAPEPDPGSAAAPDPPAQPGRPAPGPPAVPDPPGTNSGPGDGPPDTGSPDTGSPGDSSGPDG
jgi:membrane peptidoglycan carboxypeptidase